MKVILLNFQNNNYVIII